MYLAGPYPYCDFERARKMAASMSSSFVTEVDDQGKPIGLYDMHEGKWLETEEDMDAAIQRMKDKWSLDHILKE